MKILMICAGGVSTSILMKKMEKFAASKGAEAVIVAKGICEYEQFSKDFDLILLGPQISYKRTEIENKTEKPVLAILPADFATGNVENIFKQIDLATRSKIYKSGENSTTFENILFRNYL